MIIAICIIPLTLFKKIFEYIYSKTIIYNDNRDISDEDFSELEGTVSRFLKKQKEIPNENKVKRIMQDLSSHSFVDDHLKNKIIMKHFVHEHLNIFDRFLLGNNFFNHDSAKREKLNIFLWLFSLFITVCTWLYFCAYIYMWSISNEYKIIYAWGVTFIFSWTVKVFLIEIIGI